MAPAGTLWTVPVQWKGKIIKAVAALGNIEIAPPAAYEHFVDNKKPEFLSKFPHGKIPAWEGADGFKLVEGLVIARYLASISPNSGLLASSPEDAALVDQWNHLSESEIDAPLDYIRYLCSGSIAYSKPVHTFLVERSIRALKTLEGHLASRTFFVGERITLADIVVATVTAKAVGTILDPAARADFVNIIRHMETVLNQPKIKDIYGEIQFTDKAIAYTPPAKEKKEPKPAPPPAEKKEKKPKAKEPEDDDEEDAAPAPPKVKNPLDDLPKSTLNLEDWKRAYSNLDTRGPGGSLEWFYKNYDPEGYSLWRVDFKYNEELTQIFMSSNQIGGFFNRLEASRKYLFGSVGVLGEPNNSVISGAFILRGKDHLPVVDVAPDWESYSFTPLDLNKEEDKAFFEAALAWDLEIDGKKWADGKNFK